MADNAHTIDIQDNRTVVGLLRAGDEKCFDALFRRYYKPLCTYATRFVPPVRAEELVQDTLMWVWENRTSLIPEMPLKSLLFTIVKNKSLNSASRDTLKNRIIRQLAEHYEESCSYLRQHISLPQVPLIFTGFSDKPCSFAIFIETG